MPSALMLHSIAHCMDGICMPGIVKFIGILAMASCGMHVIAMLSQCTIIGMAQFMLNGKLFPNLVHSRESLLV